MLPVVFVVLNNEGLKESDKAVEKIKKLCEEELPEYAQPKEIKIIDKLPLTPIGKVDLFL